MNRVTTVAGSIVFCSDELSQGSYFQLQSFPLEPMYLFVSMAVLSEKGPAGSQTVNEHTPFPNSFEIDYVRFWKKTTDHIEVFPNPTSGLFNVKSKSGTLGNIIITNAEGQPVFSSYSNNMETAINISGAINGLYFLAVKNDGGVLGKKNYENRMIDIKIETD